MSARTAAWLLVVAAYLLALAGAFLVALFVALAAALVYVTAPTPAQRDARRRNQAHPRSGR